MYIFFQERHLKEEDLSDVPFPKGVTDNISVDLLVDLPFLLDECSQ